MACYNEVFQLTDFPMTTPPIFLEHTKDADLNQQAQQLRVQADALYLRNVEIMFLELRRLLADNPSIVQLSYDQEGDVNCMPMFSCLDEDGNDLAEEIEGVEELSETWNARQGNATEAFLSCLEGFTFHRDTFEADVGKACNKMMKEDALQQGRDITQWKSSFTSYLESLRLDQAAPTAGKLRGGQRRI